uniref:CCHC-type domain-containing protein n=1 Tax=Chenopodium quinoa TaxID=63459 RepID=A0A803N2Z4_CHEQI
MRIKVLLDINKPMKRGLKISTGLSSSKWVGLKYERLADYCYFCGRLDHTEKDCQFLD